MINTTTINRENTFPKKLPRLFDFPFLAMNGRIVIKNNRQKVNVRIKVVMLNIVFMITSR
jgi:hypothetical protein